MSINKTDAACILPIVQQVIGVGGVAWNSAKTGRDLLKIFKNTVCNEPEERKNNAKALGNDIKCIGKGILRTIPFFASIYSAILVWNQYHQKNNDVKLKDENPDSPNNGSDAQSSSADDQVPSPPKKPIQSQPIPDNRAVQEELEEKIKSRRINSEKKDDVTPKPPAEETPAKETPVSEEAKETPAKETPVSEEAKETPAKETPVPVEDSLSRDESGAEDEEILPFAPVLEINEKGRIINYRKPTEWKKDFLKTAEHNFGDLAIKIDESGCKIELSSGNIETLKELFTGYYESFEPGTISRAQNIYLITFKLDDEEILKIGKEIKQPTKNWFGRYTDDRYYKVKGNTQVINWDLYEQVVGA